MKKRGPWLVLVGHPGLETTIDYLSWTLCPL
jgi:hypothetical protein